MTKEVQIGEELLSLEKEITQDKINRYADCAFDFNPIHVDPEYAGNTPFKGTIAHGLYVLAFASEMMTRRFGKGWLCGGKLEVRWRAPIRPGDRITVKAKVAERKTIGGKEYAVCDLVWENQREEKVLIGTASAKI
jgi:acyl dehydratase